MKNYILSLLGSFLFCLGYPSFLHESGHVIFTLCGLTLFFNSLNYKDTLQDVLKLFILSLTLNFVGFYWIAETLQTFGGLHFSVAYLASLFFSLIVMPFLLPFYFIAKKIRAHSYTDFVEVFLFSTILATLEYFIPAQFPVRIGQSWMNHLSFLGLAPIFGLIFYSFVSYFIIFSAIKVFKNYKENIHLVLISFLLLTSCLLSRPWFITEKSLPLNSEKLFEDKILKLRIVQSNIGNYMKIQSELGQFNSISEVHRRYYQKSTENLDQIDLLIWPETSFPQDINSDFTSKAPYPISRVLDNTKSAILFGGYDIGDLKSSQNSIETIYNSAFYFDKNQDFKNVYHKQKLIPFGETLPFGPFTSYFIDKVPAISFFSQGKNKTVFSYKEKFHFITPICYEILSSSFIRELIAEGIDKNRPPHFMVNLTNDSWYGKTAEPYQHLFLAKWRALELQTPFVRSTNSGITSVIDVDGTESDRLLLGEVNYLDLKLKMVTRRPTLFQRYGVLTFYIFLLFLLAINLLASRLQKRYNSN
jgi:apolipoprotein N-acyltransferase